MKYLLYLLLTFSTTKLSAQTTPLYLLESTMGKTETTTVAFLKGILRGTEPTLQYSQGFRSYDLDNEDVHIEYKIQNGACVIAAAHFKNATQFNRYYVNVIESTKDLKGYRIKKLDTGQVIIYEVNANEKTIIAFTYEYIMTAE